MSNLPDQPIRRWVAPVRRFLHVEAAGGVSLLACTAAALLLANSPLGSAFHHFWETPVSLGVGSWSLAGELGHLVVNDGLMALFFFVVGLEIKRELMIGELREWRAALLPAVAALGGMVAPMAVYLSLQWEKPGQDGWAIPMATDIAFVVGVMSLLGRRVPFGLKVMILSLAIVDDLGAVLVIAAAFSSGLAYGWLAAAGVGLLLCYSMNRAGVRSVGLYAIVGVYVWYAVYRSGIHPTVAGVALGFLTPTTPWVRESSLFSVLAAAFERLRGEINAPLNDAELRTDLADLQFAAREAVPPLQRLEQALHPWVAFGIMPLFALANAGVAVHASGLQNPVALATGLGLVLGKPAGILLFCWVAVKLGLVKLPHGVGWGMMLGGGCLAGIGFTMSLFLTGLSFPAVGGGENPHASAAKFGVLLGSVASALLGAAIIWRAGRHHE